MNNLLPVSPAANSGIVTTPDLLTQEDVARYRQLGFARIPQVLTGEEVAKFLDEPGDYQPAGLRGLKSGQPVQGHSGQLKMCF